MPIERFLHHFPLDPFSRQGRLVLGEKKLAFNDVVERYWEQPASLLSLNPSGLLPVLVEEGGDDGAPRRMVACESRAVLEYVEEQYPTPRLLPEDPAERAEARRLMTWFDRKFDFEVNGLLLHEKMEKRLLKLGSPDLATLRRGREMLRGHMEHLEAILQARDWLAGRRMSLADLVAAAHLSVVDYLGEAPWKDFPAAKTWYMKLKSRPCFRPLLADKMPGLPPAPHYDDLDF